MAQDAETAGAITAALLAYYTSSQVDALLGDYRTVSAQDTQTQAAIAGALLAYRTGPDQDVFTTNQITSALVAYRSAADQDTATAGFRHVVYAQNKGQAACEERVSELRVEGQVMPPPPRAIIVHAAAWEDVRRIACRGASRGRARR